MTPLRTIVAASGALAAAFILPMGVAQAASGATSPAVRQVSVGYAHRCLVTTGGDAYCWGWNPYGQLGDGTDMDRTTPVRVMGLGGKVATIAAGTTSTCATLTTGSVKCWGQNTSGQLGNGSTTDSFSPVQVAGLSSGWTGVGVGDSFVCARSRAGAVKCWGDNYFSQLGNGVDSWQSTVPVDVVGMRSGVSTIAVAAFGACAIKEGGLKCWGSNDTGALGVGNAAVRESDVPVQVKGLTRGVRAVSADANAQTLCAVTTAGAAKCWGHNYAGGVGNGTTSYGVYAPTQVVGLTSRVSSIAVGGGTTCAVHSGAMKCWGDGFRGSRASGDQRDRTTPGPAKVLTSGVGVLAMGETGGCTVRTRQAWCWGHTTDPQPFSLVPAPVNF